MKTNEVSAAKEWRVLAIRCFFPSFALSILCLVCGSTIAGVQVIKPVSQSRYVTGSNCGGTTFVSASGFSDFNTNFDFSCGGSISDSMSQNSYIRDSLIYATGSMMANGLSAESSFSVTFKLSAPCTYSLSGNIQNANVFVTTVFVALNAPTSTVYKTPYPTGGCCLDFSK